MRIRKLDTERPSDVRAWARVPFELYTRCAQWVPPLITDEKNLLNRHKHPFYQHSDADFFLAEESGRAVGRIAVMENRHYNQHYGTRDAFFGLFESIDDTQVSGALFEAAFGWARQRGLARMLGPRGLLPTDNCGILVEGFQHRPAVGVSYNLPYYGELVEAAGFEKRDDSLSGYLGRDHGLPQRLLDLADRVKERRGFWIKTFRDQRELRAWAPHAASTFLEAFGQNDLFYPPTSAEMQMMVGSILAIAVPRYMKLVMKGDAIIGFVFTYPDISAGLQRARGRLWPLGWYHILRERGRTLWANGNGIGVLPEYQGLGASVLLYAEAVRTLWDSPFQHVDVVQVGEHNQKSRAMAEELGVAWYKTHRSYLRAL